MKFKFALSAATFAVCLTFAGTSRAAVYLEPNSIGGVPTIAESGDAGDLPATAQVLPGVAGSSYTSITGTTTATNGLYDSDMFRITVGGSVTLTASTAGGVFTPGVNAFDSQLALFGSTGVGLAVNDDAASGGSQSSLTFNLGAGTYYLLISGSGRYAVDATGALIFPNYTDGTTDPSGTYTATSTLPIAGYTGSSNEGGNYNIAITTVPEPGSLAGVLAGVTGLALVVLRRRTA